VVAYRDDAPRMQHINFEGDAWLDYVPIRMLDTICVQEQLPPEAVAVLINRTHTYPDIVMPIDATEKRLLDCLDGNSSIGDIADHVFQPSGRKTPRDTVRSFFERLWRHDQVVFDASGEGRESHAPW
jgi:hypothetical protein